MNALSLDLLKKAKTVSYDAEKTQATFDFVDSFTGRLTRLEYSLRIRDMQLRAVVVVDDSDSSAVYLDVGDTASIEMMRKCLIYAREAVSDKKDGMRENCIKAMKELIK